MIIQDSKDARSSKYLSFDIIKLTFYVEVIYKWDSQKNVVNLSWYKAYFLKHT